jgi:SAM-dependent methyltransferase
MPDDWPWPFPERRVGTFGMPTNALHTALSDWLRREAEDLHHAIGAYRLLDVGCGGMPYYPWFEPYVSEYVALDAVDNPLADLHGPIEAIPTESAAFDVVLCTQVLEHCDDPAQAVRELRRVLAPGGRVLASTHGVQVYHPSPQDLWRWTHDGLRRLFDRNAEWASLEVTPAAGTASALAMLLGTYVEIALRRTPLARPPVWLLNRAGAALEGRITSLREPLPGSLIPNFHVVADAP